MSIIIPANSAVGGGYDVDNSCRFNDNSSDYMTRSESSGTSNQKSTFSTWFKRGGISDDHYFFDQHTNTSNSQRFQLRADDRLQLYAANGGSTIISIITTQVFRDVSAWYHIVLALDSTQGTASDRVKFYVNGTRVTAFDSATYPNQNTDLKMNASGITYYLGTYGGATSSYSYDGYMSETVYIDGTQNDVTDFGEFDGDSGIWVPKSVSGLTFGNNGFYLDFEDSSALGNDAAGSNNLTLYNLTAIDQTTDTCTNNFCTANPLHHGSGSISNAPLSDGNLTFTSSQAGSPYPYYFSTFAASQGKWYAEFKVTTANSAVIGIGTGAATGYLGAGLYDYSYYYDGTFYNYGSNQGSQSSYTDGDIIGVALDLDNNKIYVAKNNTWQHSGNPAGNSGGYTIVAPASQTGSTSTGVYHIAYGDSGGGTPAIQGNFGNPPFTGTDQADGNDRGSFEYAPPSGFLSLCTKNLSEVLS